MELHRFYCPDLVVEPEGIQPTQAILPPEEAQHAIKVLRLKEGDALQLVNGKGWVFDGVLRLPHPKTCLVSITSAAEGTEARPGIHIAIAPPKNIARLEWFLEKATEIGIGSITPLICERSERIRINTERLERILVAAMKQSKRSFLPLLRQQSRFRDVIESTEPSGKYLAWLSDDSMPLQDVHIPGTNSLVLIGPEGDFSPEEVKMARENGFKPISLGAARLRTETAALYACTALNILNHTDENK
jgi:16S rRNA (uracil1498-N3)-methyltransferase